MIPLCRLLCGYFVGYYRKGVIVMPVIKLTKEEMATIVKPVKGQVDYYDADLTGFGCRATRDKLTFFVYRRVKGEANKTFIKIGAYGTFTPKQARDTAKGYIREMEDGRNPDPALREKKVTITVDDLFRQYMDNRKTLAVATRYQYESWFKNCLADWQDRDITQITGGMVVDKLNDLAVKSGKVQAQNAVKLLRTCYRFGLAIHPQIMKHNPVDAVKVLDLWEKPSRRKTRVNDVDLPAWYQAVTGYSNPAGRDYLLFLIFTGLRRTEAATMQWSDIDLKAATFSFVPEKKHQGKGADKVTMPMSTQLCRILKLRRAMFYEGDFVFPGRGGKPYISNPRHWQIAVTAETGIKFCFHDLRRTFITIAESLDIPHYALKALLNHAMGNDVTGGYVVMSVDRLRDPAQKVADRIMELATMKPEVEGEGGTVDAIAA